MPKVKKVVEEEEPAKVSKKELRVSKSGYPLQSCLEFL
jgi:hypothetical protein